MSSVKNLPDEMLHQIYKKIDSPVDQVAFSSVCRVFRHAVAGNPLTVMRNRFEDTAARASYQKNPDSIRVPQNFAMRDPVGFHAANDAATFQEARLVLLDCHQRGSVNERDIKIMTVFMNEEARARRAMSAQALS